MIAMTTRSSTSVKPWTFLRFMNKTLRKKGEQKLRHKMWLPSHISNSNCPTGQDLALLTDRFS
jgi:hypothetical protein